MANTISDDRAVQIVQDEFSRLGIQPQVAYGVHKADGNVSTLRMSQDVRIEGPKGKRTVALYFNPDGSDPDVLVGLNTGENRGLETGDVVKLGKLERK
jgi:hypothetical protein